MFVKNQLHNFTQTDIQESQFKILVKRNYKRDKQFFFWGFINMSGDL